MQRAKQRYSCEHGQGSMKVIKATTEKPYRYELSGLDNIYLVGIDVIECEKCPAREPLIPKIGRLHKTIAKYLFFKKDLLTGKELRFLRKDAGISAKSFAVLLDVDPSHLSRIENGKLMITAGTDKLARAIVAAVADGAGMREILLSEADKKIAAKRATFGLKKDQWENLAA